MVQASQTGHLTVMALSTAVVGNLTAIGRSTDLGLDKDSDLERRLGKRVVEA